MLFDISRQLLIYLYYLNEEKKKKRIVVHFRLFLFSSILETMRTVNFLLRLKFCFFHINKGTYRGKKTCERKVQSIKIFTANWTIMTCHDACNAISIMYNCDKYSNQMFNTQRTRYLCARSQNHVTMWLDAKQNVNHFNIWCDGKAFQFVDFFLFFILRYINTVKKRKFCIFRTHNHYFAFWW